jgi:hypothetical protein
MATLGDVYAALPGFRAALHQQRFEAGPAMAGTRAFRGAFAGMATPLTNVHATGVGVRVRNGKIVDDDFVIKVYVFDKLDLGAATPALTKGFGDVGVDVEHLPVQLAFQKKPRKVAARRAALADVPANRRKHRPIVGGLSIAPLSESYVGTLGCFVRRRVAGAEQIFALSNNHVLADTNRLPVGASIIQPGAETGTSDAGDAFAALSEFIPIRFPTDAFNREVNRFDAAIARVTDLGLIRKRAMFGIGNYDPEVSVPQPGMQVIKSGRTTGVTTGHVTAVGVNSVQINYGTQANPIIATFNDTVEIVGDDGQSFSKPGDSGSVILEKRSGKPVALLFAGDSQTTTACSFAGVCRHFQVDPV